MNKNALIVLLLIAAGLGVAGSSAAVIYTNRSLLFSSNRAGQVAIPTPVVIHTVGSTDGTNSQQIRSFAFLTVTPTFAPSGTKSLGETFIITDGSIADTDTFAAEQETFQKTYGFSVQQMTIAGVPSIVLSGTMPYADLNYQRVMGPAQWSVFYITHGTKMTKLQYEYLGAKKDAAREKILSTMVATIVLH